MSGSGSNSLLTLIYLVLIVVYIAGMWTTFSKAGQPGWAAIIPIYNYVILARVAGKPGWWAILFFVPFVNIVIWFILVFAVAANFSKGTGFAIGLALLPFVFFPILGFGDARYRGAQSTQAFA